MADIVWLVQRLKAMSIPEVMWRVGQKVIQKKEERRFKAEKVPVTAGIFNQGLSGLRLDAGRMHLNRSNKDFSLNTAIPLLGNYAYEKYKKQWNAGFQTENEWPEEFSYSLEYKQRDDIGDARTNWELNRHFQFALLAKDYAASSDPEYLEELCGLFEDWNRKNPFLWGISWTSVMETAIRCSNWCYTYCFLENTNVPEALLEKLRIGIINMADHITKHYSRFSSANNHLIVEAYAIGQTGILCSYKPWIDLALKILTGELLRQNYPDGVNRELSLHYQSFYMEAMGLMMRLLVKNGIAVPDSWEPMIQRMCGYVVSCMGKHDEMVVFGDDDEGKILDLQGGFNHYQYMLGLFSCLLKEKYLSGVRCCENLNWLFSEEELERAEHKPPFQTQQCACFREGGNTILRSRDGRVLIGIDHAALGFGSIAAHGHADALSFQLFLDGQPVFVDPGTCIYHCNLESRNAFRKTENHNTACIDGKDQSEILGAFLWGKRAECELLEFTEEENGVILKARHNGYRPVIHTREFRFDKERVFEIRDTFTGGGKKEINFIFAPDMEMGISDNVVYIHGKGMAMEMKFFGNTEFTVRKTEKMYSPKYGVKMKTGGIKVCLSGGGLVSVIQLPWNRREEL